MSLLTDLAPRPEMLGVVEDMARRLLAEEEVAAVMQTCRRVRGRAASIAAQRLRIKLIHPFDSHCDSTWPSARWRT